MRVVWEILREVRLLFSSVGRGWEAGAGVNDVLAHLPKTLDNAVTGMVLYSPPQSKGLWGGSDTLRSQKLRAEGLCP